MPTYRSDDTRSQCNIFLKGREVDPNLFSSAGFYNVSCTFAYKACMFHTAPPGLSLSIMSKWLRENRGFGTVLSS